MLEIAYRLHGNKIDVIWEVTNPGGTELPFQIGAHPAFLYPDYDPQARERGFFSFDRKDTMQCIRLVEKGCVDAQTLYPLELDERGMYPLASDTFDVIDTLMLQDSQLRKVTLHRPDGTPWLSLAFEAPVVGLWSPPGKNAPFICIEPWYGRCDSATRPPERWRRVGAITPTTKRFTASNTRRTAELGFSLRRSARTRPRSKRPASRRIASTRSASEPKTLTASQLGSKARLRRRLRSRAV